MKAKLKTNNVVGSKPKIKELDGAAKVLSMKWTVLKEHPEAREGQKGAVEP